jgi:hypothetical protein
VVAGRADRHVNQRRWQHRSPLSRNRGVAYFGPAKVVGCSTAINKQIDRQRTVKNFRRLATDVNPTVQRRWVLIPATAPKPATRIL